LSILDINLPYFRFLFAYGINITEMLTTFKDPAASINCYSLLSSHKYSMSEKNLTEFCFKIEV